MTVSGRYNPGMRIEFNRAQLALDFCRLLPYMERREAYSLTPASRKRMRDAIKNWASQAPLWSFAPDRFYKNYGSMAKDVFGETFGGLDANTLRACLEIQAYEQGCAATPNETCPYSAAWTLTRQSLLSALASAWHKGQTDTSEEYK